MRYLTPIAILAALFVCFHTTLAQDGDYYVTQYIIDPDKVDNPYFSITQDNKGIMIIANRNGLLEYDGKRWERIETPGTIFSIQIIDDNTIFVGGKAGFGMVERNNDYDLKYRTLSEGLERANDIFSIQEHNGYLYFLNRHRIFVLDPSSEKIIHTIHGDNVYLFDNLFKLNNNLYVAQETGDIFLIEGGELKPVSSPLTDSNIFFTRPLEGTAKTLICTYEDEIFVEENGQITRIAIDDNEYIENNDITDAVWLNERLVAIGTLKGGVVFINLVRKEVIKISNNKKGLTNNEVMAMALDRDGGLWVGEGNGLDRIAPFLPITSFNNYPGLSGNLLTLDIFNDELYVSTTQGIFVLKEVPEYREVVYYTRQEVDDVEESESVKEMDEEEPDRKKRRGFLKFLFGSKKNEESDDDKPTEARTNLVRNVRKELVSLNHKFLRIKGIESEAEHFVEYDDRLLCGGLDGVYEIRGDSSVRIQDESARTLFASERYGKLFVNTLTEELIVYELIDGNWEKLETVPGLRAPVYHTIEDNEGNLWLSSVDRVYRIMFKEGEITEITHYDLINPFFDRTFAYPAGGTVHFINPSGYFYYDHGEDSLLVNDKLKDEIGLPQKYIYDPIGNVWLNNGERWYRIHDGEYTREDVLHLFTDLSFVQKEPDKPDFWIITRSNEIYKFTEGDKRLLSSRHNLFLREVKSSQGKLAPVSIMEVNEMNSSLTFEFVQPDFAGFYGIQYRHKLVGLEEEWSDWTTSNNIKFNFLPTGSYTILVQTKDIFGQITTSDPLTFEVVPPYWRTTWFYALEITIVGLLLFASIRLKGGGKRHRIISRLLAFLTLILVVEFIQNIGETIFDTHETPVIDFLIQVSIAFALLPFESIVRRTVLNEESVKPIKFKGAFWNFGNKVKSGNGASKLKKKKKA